MKSETELHDVLNSAREARETALSAHAWKPTKRSAQRLTTAEMREMAAFMALSKATEPRLTKSGTPDRRASVATAQAAAMTPEQKSARAKAGAAARWSGEKTTTLKVTAPDALLISQGLRKLPATLDAVALLARVDAIFDTLRT